MDANDYQLQALRTALPIHLNLTYLSLGLCNEAGELAGHVKHVVFHGHTWTREIDDKMIEELGDVAWYVAVAAHQRGYSFDDVLRLNLAKLRKRYPEGFSTEGSVSGRGGHRETDGS